MAGGKLLSRLAESDGAVLALPLALSPPIILPLPLALSLPKRLLLPAAAFGSATAKVSSASPSTALSGGGALTAPFASSAEALRSGSLRLRLLPTASLTSVADADETVAAALARPTDRALGVPTAGAAAPPSQSPSPSGLRRRCCQ